MQVLSYDDCMHPLGFRGTVVYLCMLDARKQQQDTGTVSCVQPVHLLGHCETENWTRCALGLIQQRCHILR